MEREEGDVGERCSINIGKEIIMYWTLDGGRAGRLVGSHGHADTSSATSTCVCYQCYNSRSTELLQKV